MNMARPTTYQAYRRTAGPLPMTIEKVTEEIPTTLGADEVLIHIHAVSLNFRDVAMLDGRYPLPFMERGIPASDCAAEVVEIGSGVTDFKVGDRVINTIDLNNTTDEDEETPLALGGEVEGVLSQFAVFKEKHLLHMPAHLSWEEPPFSSPSPKQLTPPTGTGGVSTTALLLCLAAGIHPIITSSSDTKLSALLHKLALSSSTTATIDSISTINYRTHPAWEAEAKRLTAGRGVDIVVNNAGPTSLAQDVEALAPRRGMVSVVGFLGGLEGGGGMDAGTVLRMMVKGASVRGVAGAPKSEVRRLNEFVEEKGVRFHAAIDRVFGFEEAGEAFGYLREGRHVGKVVVRM
ncbi:alcohol dehydrogenase [Lasiodiplodia theobromae]|uniref:alcohol dehydrogenase n=1 Tax=Lasiodiplodia theobromae TaxID=45133 RepID=UPI0015C3A361|nr:alcohol dehydrogenase [Lasiodiplodia theobromae]KAF4544626.1 alcohol dehydrogenase [Lasiodiplodia theobromae]